MIDGGFVKHENVAQCRTGEVNHQSKDPCYDVQRDQLPPDIVAIPSAHVGIFAGL